MDAHFVPNLTFGAKTIKHLRQRTELPFDAHLMVDEPGRFLDDYLEAGCDSITFHVEIEEAIAPTLRRIRAAGRAAGLAVKPATPLSALEPYRELLDIVLVMTVEPGFGGQSFMKDVARDKLLAARDLLSHRAFGGEVHVDGGINRETAEFAGGLGVDILVVGSALFIKGHDMGREIRLIRALADEGYQYTLNGGVPPIPRDRMVTFSSLPKHLAQRFADQIEAGGVPVVMLRGGGQMNPDGVRDYDLLVPASAEALVVERFAAARARYEQDADAWRDGLHRASTASSRRPASREGAPPANDRGAGARRRRGRRRDRAGLVVLLGVGPDDTDAIAEDLARKAAELRIFRDAMAGRTCRCSTIGGAALVVSQFTLYADTRRGRRPGFTAGAAPRSSPNGCTSGSRRRSRRSASRSRPARSGPRWRSSSSTTARSRSGSIRRTASGCGDTARMATADGKPDPLRRLGGGRWETKDGRFQIEPQSGTWVIVDTTQTNEFGLPLVRGPFPSLTAAREAIEVARGEGPATSPLADRIEQASAGPTAGSKDAGRRPRRAIEGGAAKPDVADASAAKAPIEPPEPTRAARATLVPRPQARRPQAGSRVIARLRALDVEEAEAVARAEVVDGRPALARLALERRLRKAAAAEDRQRRAVADAIEAFLAGEDDELGTGWRLVDDRERPIRALDLEDD